MDEEEEKIGEEDSQFMKLAKKLTAKKLQKKGELMYTRYEIIYIYIYMMTANSSSYFF